MFSCTSYTPILVDAWACVEGGSYSFEPKTKRLVVYAEHDQEGHERVGEHCVYYTHSIEWNEVPAHVGIEYVDIVFEIVDDGVKVAFSYGE